MNFGDIGLLVGIAVFAAIMIVGLKSTSNKGGKGGNGGSGDSGGSGAN